VVILIEDFTVRWRPLADCAIRLGGRPGPRAFLKEKMKQGDKALMGNKGYRKYLKREGEQAGPGLPRLDGQ